MKGFTPYQISPMNHRMYSRNKIETASQRFGTGFTLVEILVAIFIFTLVIFSIFAAQNDFFFLNNLIQNTLSSQDETKATLKMMIKEVRSSSPSSIGAYPIAEAAVPSFTFYADIDNNGSKERVRYFLDADTLKKGTLKPTGSPLTYNPANETVKIILHNVANGAVPLFEYYDTSYDGTSPPLPDPVNISEVRLIKITLLVDEHPNEPAGVRTFTTQISIRNLKDNL